MSMYRKFKPRTYHGESEAVDLLAWLNEENPSDLKQNATANVERIIELVQSLYAMSDKLGRKGPSPEFEAALVEGVGGTEGKRRRSVRGGDRRDRGRNRRRVRVYR